MAMHTQTIKIAVVGVGNCASALVQAIRQSHEQNEPMKGLMNVLVGDYRVEDIEVVAAFDVHTQKVGYDLADAVFTAPNNTLRFASVPQTGVTVTRGPTLDGIGEYLADVVPLSNATPVDVAQALRDSGAQVLVNYLPVGAEDATRYYMEQALAAGCAVVNCIPVFIASDPEWAARFKAAGLPIIGDDIKSQLGATIVHRNLIRLFCDRGITVNRTYQLNFGGNTDFQNMLERKRLESKKLSKTRAVTSQTDGSLRPTDVHVGPSDHVPWLEDRKWAQIRIEGTGIGGAPVNLELKLEVWDSPNSAGVVLDAVRCLRIALDRGEAGPIEAASSYLMKSPPVQHDDTEAMHLMQTYMDGPAKPA
jgi:myo-inositol-1-phosphate synthase